MRFASSQPSGSTSGGNESGSSADTAAATRITQLGAAVNGGAALAKAVAGHASDWALEAFEALVGAGVRATVSRAGRGAARDTKSLRV